VSARRNVLRDLLREAGRRWRVAELEGRLASGRSHTPGGVRTEAAGTARSRIAGALERVQRAPPATIVVPIHNAPDEVKACIDSLFRHTPDAHRIFLMEDASHDPRVEEVLAKCANRANLEIHRSNRNLGFTRTVNRAIDLADRSDVLLLNSDTEVTPRWMENLRLAAYSGDRVATATPLSNNAGAFSAPEPEKENKLPHWLGRDDFSRLVTRSSSRTYPHVPTGNGFCMYIRRDAIDRIGSFDANAFPVGYGEENDFCMRALHDGWGHVVDDATIIYHVRSASFGDARGELLKRGRAVLDARYPDYTGRVRAFARDPALRAVRERIATVLADCVASRKPVSPRLLLAWTDWDSRAQAHAAGWEPLLLRRAESSLELLAISGAGAEVLERIAWPPKSGDESAGRATVLATWLALYAVENVYFFGAKAESEALCAACGRLNIPLTST